jgi:general secretion pathway protein K
MLRSGRASILILVSWVLLLISVFTLSLGFAVQQRLRLVQRLEQREKLRFIAEAGVKRAIFVLTEDDASQATSHTLRSDWAEDKGNLRDISVGQGFFTVSYRVPGEPGQHEFQRDVRYGLVDEESKLNINLVDSPEILKRLLEEATDLPDFNASVVADSIMDWRDGDDHRYLDGAERAYYRGLTPSYAPKNAQFGALEETLLVKGMTSDAFNQMRPHVTVDGLKTVNLNTASRAVLIAIGLSKPLAQKVMDFREGKDKKPNTGDDRAFSSLGDVIGQLNAVAGLDDNEIAFMQGFLSSGWVGLESKHFSIESAARLDATGRREFVISCVVRRDGSVIRWNEAYQS